jgi:acetyltransferase-like isoleucine patch superfamily enzyme/dTDP-4-dehydrorhamnose 3,5-epimerase-like enzyme
MIHPTADVQSAQIGENTQIWQFCVVLPGARIGSDCNICSHCFIENDVAIGNNVTIKNGVQAWDGIVLEDDVFIGPNVTFTNDENPRSRQRPDEFLKTVVKKGASIGANATLLPGIVIGKDALVGAGSVVTSDVPPGTVVVGNPARVLRYAIDSEPATNTTELRSAPIAPIISGVHWIELTSIHDVRGHLTVAEWSKHLPFEPKRVFFVHRVPSAKVRGAHAHRQCQQILLCLTGSVHVVVDDGAKREEMILDSPDRALLVPAGIWATQYRYSKNAVLAVFASHEYNEDDYIRDYDQYLNYKQQ